MQDQGLTLVWKEAKWAAAKLGPAMCLDSSELCPSWLDAEGGAASRATVGTNNPGTCSVPNTAPTRWLPSHSLVWPGREQGSGSTCSSPGVAAPATSKLRVTQPPSPPPPHTIPFLKHCPSSISFTSHFPYHIQHWL